MKPVEQFPYEGSTAVTFAKDQPQYDPLPALVFQDGAVLTEWELSEEERAAILAGENIRLWIWLHPHRCPRCSHVDAPRLQPVALALTDERKG